MGTFDGNGNPPDYNSISLGYDYENRLDAGTSGSTSYTWGYDGDGTFDTLLAGGSFAALEINDIAGNPLVEFNGSGYISAVNTFGANGLVGRYTLGASTPDAAYAFDQQGNTVQHILSTLGTHPGTVDNWIHYLAGGQGRVSTQGTGGNAVETYSNFESQYGYRTDPVTGLELVGNRYLDYNDARWLTRDPIGQSGGINTYEYAGDNPTDRIDPSGLEDAGDDIIPDNGGIYTAAFDMTGGAFNGPNGATNIRALFSANPATEAAYQGYNAVSGCDAASGQSLGGLGRLGAGIAAALTLASLVDPAGAGGDEGKAFPSFGSQLHHIATDKHSSWTPKFMEIFSKFELNLDDPSNLVNLPFHSGRHPEAYHKWVYDMLSGSSSRQEFLSTLSNIKAYLLDNPGAVNSGPYRDF